MPKCSYVRYGTVCPSTHSQIKTKEKTFATVLYMKRQLVGVRHFLIGDDLVIYIYILYVNISAWYMLHVPN